MPAPLASSALIQLLLWTSRCLLNGPWQEMARRRAAMSPGRALLLGLALLLGPDRLLGLARLLGPALLFGSGLPPPATWQRTRPPRWREGSRSWPSRGSTARPTPWTQSPRQALRAP